MNVDVDYDTPEKQPDVTKCVLVISGVDPQALTVSGVCLQQDGSGVTRGSPIPFINLPVGMVGLTALADDTVAALQTEINPSTGKPYLPKGKIVVTP